MNKLILLSGISGSGKSKYAKEKAKEGYYIIDLDYIREMLYGEYEYKQEDERMLDTILRLIMFELDNNQRNILIDDTFLTKEIRKKFIILLQSFTFLDRYDILWVQWKPSEKCLTNRLSFVRGLKTERWISVIKNQRAAFERLTNNEVKKSGIKIEYRKV